ncbi:uncharacterized protein [Argopecten irradians]|uniref:uncharacterized protein n=1 Tax=Argopecten irradians TaxID=31199 RepID=UPI00371DF15F
MAKEDCDQTEKGSRGQSNSVVWCEQRQGRITSSNLGSVFNRKETTPPDNLVKVLCGYISFDNRFVKLGRDHEPAARNVAVEKSASQSTNHHQHGADRAVDNCVTTTLESNCCSHTDHKGSTTAWWRVDLDQLTTINAITIYYRAQYPHRFAGYQLYVSNSTSSPQDGVLCFEDISTTRDEVQMVVTHQCPYVCQYVTVYNYRNNQKRHDWYDDYAVLELCEVQVWGCPVGRYGDGKCDSVCSGNCLGGNCNATTGDCFYCVPQQYGIKCEMECPLNCLDRLCENIDGNCSGKERQIEVSVALTD